MKIKIFADGANLNQLRLMNDNPIISGITTNPSLMAAAGVTDYEGFSRECLEFIKVKPLSLEVFADDFPTMLKQAMVIKEWGNNVYVKIPVVNTKGESSITIIEDLLSEGVKVNITAIMTETQVRDILNILKPDSQCFISIFAGRIADTGRDPMETFVNVNKMISNFEKVQTIWASTREVYNVRQAEKSRADIITLPMQLISKLDLFGYSLDKFTVDTVKQFRKDALDAKFYIKV